MVDSKWEATYSSGRHVNSWPWSDLVSLYFRHEKSLQHSPGLRRVLELGTGTGNNFPFWRSIPVEYFGIEISPTAVAIFLERFPELKNRIQICDFSEFVPENEKFDVICDRASVTHCSILEIQSVVKKSLNTLKRGGLFLGIDWFSKAHSDFNLPSNQIDANTRNEFKSGQFLDVGQVHFADRADLIDIFKDFEILELTEKIVTNHYPEEGSHQFASWNIVAKKPF